MDSGIIIVRVGTGSPNCDPRASDPVKVGLLITRLKLQEVVSNRSDTIMSRIWYTKNWYKYAHGTSILHLHQKIPIQLLTTTSTSLGV